ncbi:MAG TPA: hypothetical protein ACQGQH_03305 [Xylella sp.]
MQVVSFTFGLPVVRDMVASGVSAVWDWLWKCRQQWKRGWIRWSWQGLDAGGQSVSS